MAPHADVASILDSPEVAELVGRIDGLKLKKRRGYGTRTLIGACLVRSVYSLGTWTRTAELIAEHAALAEAIGGTPSGVLQVYDHTPQAC